MCPPYSLPPPHPPPYPPAPPHPPPISHTPPKNIKLQTLDEEGVGGGGGV